MNTNEIKQLKLGDRVGFVRCWGGDLQSAGFGIVTKISARGWTVTPEEEHHTPITFNDTGWERGHSYNLLTVDDLQRQLTAKKFNDEVNQALDALEAAIQGWRENKAAYGVADAAKTVLHELVEAIPVSCS